MDGEAHFLVYSLMASFGEMKEKSGVAVVKPSAGFGVGVDMRPVGVEARIQFN